MCAPNEIRTRVSANQVARYTNPNLKWSVLHTNHPFTDDDFPALPTGAVAMSEEINEFIASRDVDSRIRYDSLRPRLGIDGKRIDHDLAMRLLGSYDSESHPVCRHYTSDPPWITIGTSIFVLRTPA